nr:ABC transporter permease [Pseudofrankia inefficax]
MTAVERSLAELAPRPGPAALGRRRGRDRDVPGLAFAASAAFLVLIALLMIAPGLFAGHSPTATDPVNALRGPSGTHWFGTDALGRDVFARVVYGARPSLIVGFGATVFAVVGATALGLTAGIGGPALDQVLMRVADVLLALPPLLLALLAVAVLGHGQVNVMVAVAIAFVPGYARVVRAETLVVRRSGYVEAAVGLGLPRWRLVGRHVLPNTLGPLLVLATVGFGSALIYASSLSFLGLGAQPPSSEWGLALSTGRNYFSVAWWVAVFPGLAATLTVIALNVTGRRARARFTRRPQGGDLA